VPDFHGILFMMGVSFPELLVIFAVAFLVVGPARLSEAAHYTGTMMRKLKNQWAFIKQTQLSGVDASALFETEIHLNKTLDDIKTNLNSPTPPPSDKTQSPS
jgi:Sec-independent protein translocase protein TatA